MTEILEYLEAAVQGRASPKDWSQPQWAAVHPVLAWLGYAPPVSHPPLDRAIASDSDIKVICDHMLLRFVDKSDSLVWSSYLLGTAVQAVAATVQGVPEPLVKRAWSFLKDRELDETAYEFCRALGREVLVRFREDPQWDLQWIKGPATDTQICLRYWILAVKPELWDDAVEAATVAAQRAYPFFRL